MNPKVKTILKNVFFSFGWLALLVFAVDIVTKWSFQLNLKEHELITLIPNFLWITLEHNLGAAFSIGSNGELWARIMWICVSFVMSFLIMFYYIKKYKTFNNWYKAALMLMFSGAVGNLIDRAFYWNNLVGFDGVIDWIKVTSWFPVFNIADSALVIGVLIIIVLLIIELIQDIIKKNKMGAYEMRPKDFENKIKEEENENKKDGNKEN